MPKANVNAEIQSGNDSLDLRSNDKGALAGLGEIYSNRNLALNVRSFTANITLDKTDTLALCDTTAAGFTVTLAPANTWSSRNVTKTPIIIIANVAGVNNITLAAGSGDTLVNIGTTLKPGAQIELFSDGSTKWYSIGTRIEEKTWTPVDGSGAALGLTINNATYVRVAQYVYFSIRGAYPITASGANAAVGGLPYATADIETGSVFSNAGANPTAIQSTGTTFNFVAAGVALTNAQMSGANFVANGFYRV